MKLFIKKNMKSKVISHLLMKNCTHKYQKVILSNDRVEASQCNETRIMSKSLP